MSSRRGTSDRRFARRTRSRRWHVLRRVAVVLSVLSLVAGGAWLVFASDVLDVEDVRVSGTRTVRADAITDAAAVPFGEPLARLDLDAVREGVEDVPAVRHADVGRSWPHTVTITITERTPVGAVRAPGGYRLIDADGVMFRTVSNPPAQLPEILLGNRDRVAQEAAAVAAALPAKLVSRISRVEAYTMDSIELQLRDGSSVVWGSAERSALKVEVLSALIDRRASVYDVSVPGSPTIEVG